MKSVSKHFAPVLRLLFQALPSLHQLTSTLLIGAMLFTGLPVMAGTPGFSSSLASGYGSQFKGLPSDALSPAALMANNISPRSLGMSPSIKVGLPKQVYPYFFSNVSLSLQISMAPQSLRTITSGSVVCSRLAD